MASETKAAELADRLEADAKRCQDFLSNSTTNTMREAAALLRASEGRVPDTDVRSILLDVVPGPDGMGQEIYAQNVGDVERKLSELSDKLEGHELAGHPSTAAALIPDGYDSGTLTGNRVTLHFERQDAAVKWFDSFCKAYDAAKGTKTMRIVLPPTAAPHPPAQQAEPTAWLVCSINSDGSLSLEHAAAWREAAHEHINDAINEHGIVAASSWVVRPAYTFPPPHKAEGAEHAAVVEVAGTEAGEDIAARMKQIYFIATECKRNPYAWKRIAELATTQEPSA